MEIIDKFRDEYEFLSNFFPAPITWRGQVWPTSEHLFQAAKTNDPMEKEKIRQAAFPGVAKKMGRLVTKRPDWDTIKVEIMDRILWEKFTQHSELGRALLLTGSCQLQEGNWWNDRFWGVDLKSNPPEGENWLGRLLMWTRAKLTYREEMHKIATDLRCSGFVLSPMGRRKSITI